MVTAQRQPHDGKFPWSAGAAHRQTAGGIQGSTMIVDVGVVSRGFQQLIVAA